MTGGLSYTTVARLVRDPLPLPGHWWLLGMLWVVALAAGLALWRRGEGFDDLVRGSAALTLVFFLTRAWLAEPNVVLVLPLVLILASLGELDRRLLTALWLIPLAFAVANLVAAPAALAHVPGRLAGVDWPPRARTTTCCCPLRAALVVAWQVAGWWTVVRLPAPRAAPVRRRGGGRVNAATGLAGGLRAADHRRARLARRRRRAGAQAWPTPAAAARPHAARRRTATSRRRAWASACPSSSAACRRSSPGAMELTVGRGRSRLAGDRHLPAWTSSSAWRAQRRRRCARASCTRPRTRWPRLHRRVPALRRPLTATSNALRRRLGWGTTYEPAGLVATVPVHVHGARRRAAWSPSTADLRGVPAGAVTEVVLMNELGAGEFDRYEDSAGASLTGAAIGTWDEVPPATASFVSSGGGVAFTLAQAPGARLLRGREAVGGRLAWAGFGYCLRPGRAALLLRRARRAARRQRTPRELGPARLPVLPPLARPLALPLPAARAGLRRREPAAGGARRPAARLHLPEPRAGAAPGARGRTPTSSASTAWRRCATTPCGSRGGCAAAASLLVAGGPLPTCDPQAFLGRLRRRRARRGRADHGRRPRRARGRRGPGRRARRGRREARRRPRPPRRGRFAPDLDALPFPARDLLPNAAYIRHGRRRYGYAVTTVMSSRGCPFACEFCSNVVFGDSYRERSPASVVDEIEQALALGYDRIAFADDVFTLRRERVVAVCDEIERRGLRFAWECLGAGGRRRPRDRRRACAAPAAGPCSSASSPAATRSCA